MENSAGGYSWEQFAWSDPKPANYIDKHIYDKLKRLKLNPSPRCDDSTFLRRAYLDCPAIVSHIERPEDAELHGSPAPKPPPGPAVGAAW